MTLEQLRIFVAVAQREHVTRAAADLHLTQSAVSAAIGALEARHATQLFDRIGRRIALTQAGRLFLIEARAVLARPPRPRPRSPISPASSAARSCWRRARPQAITGCRR